MSTPADASSRVEWFLSHLSLKNTFIQDMTNWMVESAVALPMVLVRIVEVRRGCSPRARICFLALDCSGRATCRRGPAVTA